MANVELNNSAWARPARRAQPQEHWRAASGFTIIELLAATAIAALLMGAVLMIVWQLAGDQRRLAKQETSVDAEPLVELLRRDLVRARSLVVDPGGHGFVLEGYGGLDPATLVVTGRAARIEYGLLQTDAGSWLVRRQTSLDASSSEPPPGTHPWIEYVCPAVKGLFISPMMPVTTGLGRPNGKANILQPVASTGNTAVVFDRLQLRIEWTETSRAPLLRELMLR